MPSVRAEAYMPEAGKPDGVCEECGPHGNRGVIVLSEAVVPCLACAGRADKVAHDKGCELIGELTASLHGAPLSSKPALSVATPKAKNTVRWWEGTPDDPWIRHVFVRVEYSDTPPSTLEAEWQQRLAATYNGRAVVGVP